MSKVTIEVLSLAELLRAMAGLPVSGERAPNEIILSRKVKAITPNIDRIDLTLDDEGVGFTVSCVEASTDYIRENVDVGDWLELKAQVIVDFNGHLRALVTAEEDILRHDH